MTFSSHQFLLSTALWLASAPMAVAAEAPDAAASYGGRDIIVTGALDRQDGSATGLPLTLRETPQSVTLVDRERIEAFGLTDINDLLDQVVGINVERIETDRTYYNSRGFDITSFQVDGIGLPLRWGIQFGDLDTALFENVVTVRGANAIMTGVGNPSATINYVRKRPTDTLQASLSGQYGSWDKKRVEADVSGPLNASGTLSARLIFAHQDKDSYLDFNHVNRDVYGALLAWEMVPGLTATVGYSRQDNDADGVLWGALPLIYTDGTRIDFPVSASTAADWTQWNVTDQSAFAELAYSFGEGWEAKGIFTYNKLKGFAQLLYAYGYTDKATGAGINGVTGKYTDDFDQYLGDFYASGPFTLFGREHSFAFGLSISRSSGQEYEAFSSTFFAYPHLDIWASGDAGFAEPAYPANTLEEDVTDKLTRGYAAAHLNLSDRLKAVVGFSAMKLKSSGVSYGTDQSRNDSAISPYLGAVLDLTSNISAYASYTNIFNPQVEVDIDNNKLDPAKGSSIEGGFKSEWFDKRLYVSAALFRAKQKGLASRLGTFGPGGAGPVGGSYYEGVDTTSRGFEIEIAGQLSENWAVSGGYTGLEVEDEAGDPTRTWLPTKSLKLASTYKLPKLNNLMLGAQLRWQNRIRYTDADVQFYGGVSGDVDIVQGAYAVLDLMAGVDLVDHVRATVNVRNVTDTKYLGSLEWGQAYYTAPRSVLATLTLRY